MVCVLQQDPLLCHGASRILVSKCFVAGDYCVRGHELNIPREPLHGFKLIRHLFVWRSDHLDLVHSLLVYKLLEKDPKLVGLLNHLLESLYLLNVGPKIFDFNLDCVYLLSQGLHLLGCQPFLPLLILDHLLKSFDLQCDALNLVLKPSILLAVLQQFLHFLP